MIKLQNGITLGDIMRRDDSGDGMDKKTAKAVFSGSRRIVKCLCLLDCCEGRKYHVQRSKDGTISVGCVEFTAEMVKTVREWTRQP